MNLDKKKSKATNGITPNLDKCQSNDLFQPVYLKIRRQIQQEIRVIKEQPMSDFRSDWALNPRSN